MAEEKVSTRPIAQNRKARFEFEILEELECGIALQGTEVKSLRRGQCSLAESFAMVKRGELYLVGAHIAEYAEGNVHNHPPVRDRKLLVHARELDKWDKRVREKGVTMVPLSMYFKGSRVKVQLALVKGKRMYDKRQSERARSDRREIDRAVARHRTRGPE